jgi:uncharacterized membrane protein (UPF0127 family)
MIYTKINGKMFTTKVVSFASSIQEGMMGKKFNKSYDSMLFVTKNPTNTFWMRNCVIPLDIIFIKNGKITKIHHNCPPCVKEVCPLYYGIGDLVIEVHGGTCKKFNIKKGNLVEFIK